MGEPANVPALPEGPAPAGELVVRNGRLSGARRALRAPATLIGQAPGCDVCLNVEGVRPAHCAILHTPAGPLLRDLAGGEGTRVNGQPADSRLLRHGDVLDVGPFSFAVELPPATEELPQPDLRAEREALRVQVAAVAAQQSALAEEEEQLRQRATALERQEEQLASHLEQRRRKLAELRDQLGRERAAFRAECDGARRALAAERSALERQRAESRALGEQSARERDRFVRLRQALKRRWHRHWRAQEASLRRRERELADARGRLRADSERLHQERLRLNGERELTRRQLRAEQVLLAMDQEKWHAVINHEQAERDRRARALDRRDAALARAEQALARDRRRWQDRLVHLAKEAQGLEARVANQRARLAEQAAPAAEPAGPAVADIPPPAEAGPGAARPACPVPLRELAGQLADQRAHLLEQWRQLLEVHERWQQERALAQAELEALGRRLAEREQGLRAREEAADALAGDLRRRQEALAEARDRLEGWQAQLSARAAEWEAQRGVLLAEVEARERLAADQLRRLEELHGRRTERRRQEVVRLRAAQARCEELRGQYHTLWQECQARREALTRQGRSLAALDLALERLRLELLARAPHPARAARRLERLRRREQARLEAAGRELAALRRAVAAETARLDERAGRLARQEEEMLARQDEWARRQDEWESEQAAARDEEARRRQELGRLRAQQGHAERQVACLRDEVERLARLLMDEPLPALPAPRAA
jgi:hypothetical protein